MKRLLRIIKSAASLAVMGAVFLVVSGYAYSNRIFDEISDNVIRLHVIANSDSEDDQILKLKVRDVVIEYTEKLFDGCKNVNETEQIILKEIANIRSVANECIENEGYDYKAEVFLGKHNFPAKSYGKYTFPSGEYNALRIVIGEGEGENWWCVLFPPLCYLSSGAICVKSEDEAILNEYLSDEACSVIAGEAQHGNNEVNSNCNNDKTMVVDDTAVVNETNVTVKFKIVEIFQNAASFIKGLVD